MKTYIAVLTIIPAPGARWRPEQNLPTTEVFLIKARDEEHAVNLIKEDSRQSENPRGRYTLNLLLAPTSEVPADFALATTRRAEWEK